MDDHPLISVIIPAYNKGAYLRATIDSVLTQPFRNLEVIVVDDGSTDDTSAVLQSYDTRIRRFSKENAGLQGPGSAINFGLQYARGSLIHCLDADDLVTTEYYDRVVEVFSQHAEIEAVTTDAYTIDQHGTVNGTLKLGFFHTMEQFRLEVLHHNPIIASSVIVRKQCYDRVGCRKPQFEIVDDYELWIRIGEHYTIRHLHQPLMYYRYTPEGISTYFDKMKRIEKTIVLDFYHRHSLVYFFPSLQTEKNPAGFARAYFKIAGIFLRHRYFSMALREGLLGIVRPVWFLFVHHG